MEKNTNFFRKKIVLLHSHSQRFFANDTLKFSNINIRRVTSAYVAILLSFMQLIEEYLLATFVFIVPDTYDINGQLSQKSMTSYRRNERCQRPKTSWFDFVFPFAIKNKHQLENFFFVHNGRYGYSFTFWIWAVSEFSRRQGNHKPQRFDFLIECKLSDGTCQFYFSHNENI